jgi:hypothetical protein
MGIKVKATKEGYIYNSIKAVGEEFELKTEEEFSDDSKGGWMIKLGEAIVAPAIEAPSELSHLM